VKSDPAPRGHQWLREHAKYAKIKGESAFYCRCCHALYPRPTSIKYHLEKGSCKTEQKCQAKGDSHSHQYVLRRFDSREAVTQHLRDEELDTQFIIRASGKGNVYYECNRKARQSVEKIGSRSRKTEADCPARFTVKTYEVVSRQYLTEIENSGYSAANYKETTHLMIGCLTHSHETENTKMYRFNEMMSSAFTFGLPKRWGLPSSDWSWPLCKRITVVSRDQSIKMREISTFNMQYDNLENT